MKAPFSSPLPPRASRERLRECGLILISLALATLCHAAPQPTENCPDAYDFAGDAVDYLDPDARVQARIRGIERNHLNRDVELLVRGQSTAHPGGDLRFILNYVPNHHRALHALMRLSWRDRTPKPAESGPYSVRCWLHRATVFSPKDGQAFLLLGVYTARLGQHKEAAEWLERADERLPNDVNVDYNLGLVYLELGDYSRALERAKRAYAAGYPLPGLRERLRQAGKWVD